MLWCRGEGCLYALDEGPKTVEETFERMQYYQHSQHSQQTRPPRPKQDLRKVACEEKEGAEKPLLAENNIEYLCSPMIS